MHGTTDTSTRIKFGAAVVAAIMAGAIAWSFARQPSHGSTASFGLRVQREGPHLRITWNRESTVVRGAKNGVLRISDGVQRREIQMSQPELASGNILYQMAAGDMVFECEVRDAKDRVVVTELVRVVDGMGVSKVVQPAPIQNLSPLTVAVTRRVTAEPPSARPAAKAEESMAERVVRVARTFVSPHTTPRSAPTEQLVIVPPPSGSGPVNVAGGLPASALGSPSMPAQLPVMPAKIEPETQVPVPSVLRNRPAAPNTEQAQVTQPAKALRKVVPRTRLAGAWTLKQPVEVEIEASVDTDGRVVGARLTKGAEEIGPVLSREALNAARMWVFEPAKALGHTVPGMHVIVFQFRPQ